MTVRKLVAGGRAMDVPEGGRELPEEFHELVEFGILASQRDPFDPMEKAFHDLGNRSLARTEHMHGDWALVREYPLSPQLLALSHVWKSPTGQALVVAAKGAPEAVADLCHLGPERVQELMAQVAAMAGEGLRVLGVARGTFRQAPLPDEQHDFVFEFLGLVGLADPVRPTVPEAVRECYAAGIRVVMITGDHPITALSIAGQAGLSPRDAVVTGPELEAMGDAELRERARSVNVFARMVPEQKLRLVNALKANGEVVAMTGDGVNDAPALKAADIGVAMGGRGTDVAREAASLVLLDDDFASIVRAVRLGRRIFDNLRKSMSYILAVHVPIAGMALLPVLLGWPALLYPMHIAFLELIIDPACSLAFESEPAEAHVMHRPPRVSEAPLFGGATLWLALLQGVGVLAVVLAAYAWADQRLPETEARAFAFATLVVANLALIFSNRSGTGPLWASLRTPNPTLWTVVGVAFALLLLALYVPWAAGVLRFSALPVHELGLSCALGLAAVLWFEGVKWARGAVGGTGEVQHV
jgi:P-type Ca2+ transporter type 2C